MNPVPVPVGAHYIRLLLLNSSCFAMDRDGQPNVCGGEPCACAQSLHDAISNPLWLKIERLRTALASLIENVGGHGHWDSQGAHGANCPICIRQFEATERARAVLRAERK